MAANQDEILSLRVRISGSPESWRDLAGHEILENTDLSKCSLVRASRRVTALYRQSKLLLINNLRHGREHEALMMSLDESTYPRGVYLHVCSFLLSVDENPCRPSPARRRVASATKT